MSRFFGSLGGSSDDGGSDADRMGRLRVLIIGNSGCGKTALAHLLANGKPLAKTATTVGCNTFVRLVGYDGSGGGSGGQQQSYFVELWDVGTHERYRALRSVFYSQLNGVILVHELANGRSTAGLGRWAAEVARQGTFAAPLPEDRAAAALGALPVPYLTIANKADLAAGAGRRLARRRAALFCWLDGAWAAAAAWLSGRLHGARGTRGPIGLAKAPSMADASVEAARSGVGLTASATEGRVDMQAVDAFFRDLIERRYFAATRPASYGTLPSSQGSGRLGSGSGRLGSGPLAPMPAGGEPHSVGGGSLFGGSGPSSGGGSRLGLSHAGSLNPLAPLSHGGGGGSGSLYGGGGSQYMAGGGGGGGQFSGGGGAAGNAVSASERLSQLSSARIDDLDF